MRYQANDSNELRLTKRSSQRMLSSALMKATTELSSSGWSSATVRLSRASQSL